MRAEGQAGQLRDFSRGAIGEFGMRIEAGADGGAADSEIIETVESDGNAAAITVEKTDPAGNFLAESERRGVLHVGAADLDDVRAFLGFYVESVAQLLYRRQKTPRGFRGGGDVHGRGKGVVGGLRHVDVVVRVNGFFAAHLP